MFQRLFNPNSVWRSFNEIFMLYNVTHTFCKYACHAIVFTIEQSQVLRYRQFQLVIQVGMVLSSKLGKLSMIYVWLAQYYPLRLTRSGMNQVYFSTIFGTIASVWYIVVSKGLIHHISVWVTPSPGSLFFLSQVGGAVAPRGSGGLYRCSWVLLLRCQWSIPDEYGWATLKI